MRRRTFLGLSGAAVAALSLQGSAGQVPPSGLIGSHTWRNGPKGLGGLSGLRLTQDGMGFTAITDRGGWLRGRFDRDSSGRITAVTSGPVTLLRALGASPLRKGRTDSEGLAIAPDGTLYLSFEHEVRLLRYARIDGPAENLPTPEAFADLPDNEALEAVAVDAKGVVYTLPEGPHAGVFPVWRFRGGASGSALCPSRPGGVHGGGCRFRPGWPDLPVGAGFPWAGRLCQPRAVVPTGAIRPEG